MITKTRVALGHCYVRRFDKVCNSAEVLRGIFESRTPFGSSHQQCRDVRFGLNQLFAYFQFNFDFQQNFVGPGRLHLTDDGVECTMAANHFGHFLLTNLFIGRYNPCNLCFKLL